MRPLHSLIQSSFTALYRVSVDHCLAIKSGATASIYTVNNIVSGYSKCGQIRIARRVFDEMSQRDVVSWNTMIAGFVNVGNFETALEFLKSMKRYGFSVDRYCLGSVLKGVACVGYVEVGQQLHSMIVKIGCLGNVFAGSALLDMYAKCERVEDAFEVFKSIGIRNSVTWNALISGFAQVGDPRTAFWLFNWMELEVVKIDDGTLVPLLTLLDDPDWYKLTMQVHGKIVKHGLTANITVCNATITSYSECRSIDDAERVFEGATESRDLVTWNSMLTAYIVNNKEEDAFELFLEMQRASIETDVYTYTSIISAAFEGALQGQGKPLHGLVIKRGLEFLASISNSLIAMYLKSHSKSMDEALNIFESMQNKDHVSWNSILTGFSRRGLGEDALKFFENMRSQYVVIDHYAFSAVLRSCSDLAALQLGQQVHAVVLKSGLETNEFVASSLIFMYSKSGVIEDARKSFDATPKDCSIMWNSLIFGYAQHGQGKIALDLFRLMRERRVKLDHITFVAVLTACSHIGLVEEGWSFLKSMESNYGIPPRMEHYACMIDLLGRAGRLDETKSLIEGMPFEPNAMVWKTLLGACRTCGDIELASQVASHLLELEPEEHCTYVLLSSIYGHLMRWNEKASIKRLMKERGVKKVPGWSWIEVKNEVHAFNAEDRSHPNCEEIYLRLGDLMEEIRRLNHFANSEVFLHEFDDGYGNLKE